MKKYLLSNGNIVDSIDIIFEKKSKMIKEALSTEKVLTYTKRLNNSDFEEAWLNDANVVKYRQLLKNIWNFKATDYVVNEIYVCDECKQNQNVFPFLYFWLNKDQIDYTEEKIICQHCWDSHSIYSSPIITKDNSIFHWVKIDINNKHLAYKQKWIDKLFYQFYEAENFNDVKFFQKTYDNLFVQIEKQKETGDFSDEQKCQLYDLLEMIESKIP